MIIAAEHDFAKEKKNASDHPLAGVPPLETD